MYTTLLDRLLGTCGSVDNDASVLCFIICFWNGAQFMSWIFNWDLFKICNKNILPHKKLINTCRNLKIQGSYAQLRAS